MSISSEKYGKTMGFSKTGKRDGLKTSALLLDNYLKYVQFVKNRQKEKLQNVESESSLVKT